MKFFKNKIAITLFTIVNLANAQVPSQNQILANNGSSKNNVWVIGAGYGTTNDPNFATNQNSKNGIHADVLLGTCNGTGTGGFPCSNISLNKAIENALLANHNKIYIQEGEYTVDGPIIIDGRFNGSIASAETYRNNITIEGEGFGTKISATGGYTGPIFIVKSEFNTIKNLSIFIEPNEAKIGIMLAKSISTMGGIDYPISTTNDTRYNIFENLYIGHKNRTNYGSATQLSGVYGIVLENIDVPHSAIVYNKFKNISIHGVESAILLKKSIQSPLIWIQDNVFENFDINQAVRAIDFSVENTTNTPPIYKAIAVRNTFRRFTFQATDFSNLIVNNINGNDNIFDDFKLADWTNSASANPAKRVFKLTEGAQNTIISNSNVGSGIVHAATNDIEDPYISGVDANGLAIYDTAKRTYTQLFNNSRAGVSHTKIGHFGSNIPGIGNEKSLTEIEGRLRLTAESGNAGSATTPTFGAGKVLTSDANGYATWQTLGSTAWDHSATKNIKLNGFAITNNSNATPATNTDAGLRLDNNGNVRIGTAAPFATNPAKLQVDGRAIIGVASQEMNDYDATYKLIVNGKVRVRNEVYVKQAGLNWPDYVFAKDYNLMPLNEVENHINEKGHLPNMPTAAEVEKDGIAVGDLIKRQQEKIEELTLYLIEMKKEIEALKQPKN